MASPATAALAAVGLLGVYGYMVTTSPQASSAGPRKQETIPDHLYVGNSQLGQKYPAGSNVIYDNKNRHLLSPQNDFVSHSSKYLQYF